MSWRWQGAPEHVNVLDMRAVSTALKRRFSKKAWLRTRFIHVVVLRYAYTRWRVASPAAASCGALYYALTPPCWRQVPIEPEAPLPVGGLSTSGRVHVEGCSQEERKGELNWERCSHSLQSKTRQRYNKVVEQF